MIDLVYFFILIKGLENIQELFIRLQSFTTKLI